MELDFTNEFEAPAFSDYLIETLNNLLKVLKISDQNIENLTQMTDFYNAFIHEKLEFKQLSLESIEIGIYKGILKCLNIFENNKFEVVEENKEKS